MMLITVALAGIIALEAAFYLPRSGY